MIALRLRRPEVALGWFESASRTCPSDLGALYCIAWTLTELGRLEDSLARYRELAERLPDFTAAYIGIANVLQRLGRHEEAVDAFRAALDRDPSNGLIQYNLAQSFVACGRAQDALVLYRRLVRTEPDSADAVGNLGATLGRLGHWEEALEWNQRAMTLRPNSVHAHNVAVALAELHRFREAEQAFNEALKFEPRSIELRIRLALTVAYQGRSAEAIAMLTAVLDEEPDSAAGLASLSAVLILANRPSEATEVAKTAVALHPDLAITHGALAWAFFKHGNLDEALGSYERAIEIDPANPDLRAGYGATLSTIGRHREAIIAFQRSLALDRDYLDRNPELAEHYSESLNTLS